MIYDKLKINGITWYACGEYRSKHFVFPVVKKIKQRGGKYRIIKHTSGYQIFTNKKKLATIGTIFGDKI